LEICQTERLKIRWIEESDSAFILKLLNEEAFIKNITNKNVRSHQDAIHYLREGPISDYTEFGFGQYLVSLKDSDIPIGMCGFLKRDVLKYHDLGYAFLHEFWSKGYAKEASIAVLNDGHKNHGLNTVVAGTSLDNRGSNNLLKKLGFSLKGRNEMNGKTCNFYEYSFM
jgi:RimJ/RimL family protein N-acetyltransferase